MSFSPKDPHSSEFFALDFAQILAAGDTVSGIVSVTFTGADTALVVGAPALNGSMVVFRLTGGTLGLTYELRAEVTTATGETLDLSAVLLIRKQV